MALPVDIAENALTDFNLNPVRNQQEESTLQNLRTIRHKDAFGNDIST
jgi:hypothetical protein